jgi:hypothetical protein
VPHAPQLFESVIVSVQAPPQRLWPIGQGISVEHVPPTHIWSAVQALPQAPQFIASVAVFTQVMPQRV